ncbi:MAG: Gldg family protein [Pseudomonadota bacterium]|nr:Gldg family protein [Pseudomonadota bacterium]
MKSLSKNQFKILALIPVIIIFLSLNIIGSTLLSNFRVDVTEDKVFTLSKETIPIFQNIKEPIVLRVYFSKTLGEASPQHGIFFQRIRDILKQYSSLSNGMLQIQYFDPEPFSDVEDRAVGFGLQAVPLGPGGESGYFGLAATNSTDDQEVIPFFNLERDSFIEYDLTKLVYTLSNPNQPKIGLITSLPVDGGMIPGMGGMGGTPTPPWQIMDQMREFFEVERLDSDLDEISDDIDVLVLAQPDDLTPLAAYVVDQWVLRGGKAMLFIDPNFESANNPMAQSEKSINNNPANKLLESWGLELETNVVAGDIEHAVRVNASMGTKPVISDYPAWINLEGPLINNSDAITGDLNNITVGSSGVLNIIPDTGLEIRPLLKTSEKSMRIDSQKVSSMPDIVEIFRDFIPSGEELLLAARISGLAKSAFDPPESNNNPPVEHIEKSLDDIQVIVVADSDLLADRFWVQESNFLGQRVMIPTADNANFLINGLENMTGTPALSSLRGRGQVSRPFLVIEELRLRAEQNFRSKENALLQSLETLESQVGAIEIKGDEGSESLISEDDARAVQNYRSEILSTRKELREVQRSLRSDIDNLESLLKFINIAFVPMIFGMLMVFVSLQRRKKIKT